MSGRAKVDVEGGIVTRSSARGIEDPIRTFDLAVPIHEVASLIACGFRAEFGTIDVDGDKLEVCSGAGFGSAWTTIQFQGKSYAIGAHEMAARFIDVVDERRRSG